jgi:hypothetical protein
MARYKVRTGPHRPTELSPTLASFPDLWGIYVGDGCVTGGSPLEWREVDAHAHNSTEDEWFGWVCIADPYSVITANRNPTALLKHEIAHLLCKNDGHTKASEGCFDFPRRSQRSREIRKARSWQDTQGTAGRARRCATSKGTRIPQG